MQMTFDNYGGHYHLRLRQADDLVGLLSLDDGRWLATSCPRFGLNADPVFLDHLDPDGNGRILSADVRTAIRWLVDHAEPAESWTSGSDTLPLQLIRKEPIVESARYVLRSQGVPDRQDITLAEIRAYQKTQKQARRNGDGVVPPGSIDDPEAAALAEELIQLLGGKTDVSGKPGVDGAMLDRVVKEGEAYLAWLAQGDLGEATESEILPFGAETANRFSVVAALRTRVDQFFAQCALLEFDAQALARFGLQEGDWQALDCHSTDAIRTKLAALPLAPPNIERLLPLDERAHAAHRPALAQLRAHLPELLGQDQAALTEAQWQAVLAKFAAYQAWQAAKPDTPLSKLKVDSLRCMLAGDCLTGIRSAVQEDLDVADEIEQVKNLEKLALFHQGLFGFVNNFASMPHLFDPKSRAMFEMGTLVLWGRAFTFSIRVQNRAAHIKLSQNSSIYLLYLVVSGPEAGDNYEIAVPVTEGNEKLFYVGQRGVFFDVKGRELDAQVVQIVTNPISFWELMKAPFRRFGTLITNRVDQMTTSIQKDAESSLDRAGASVQTTIQTDLKEVQKTPAPAAVAATPPAGVAATPEKAGGSAKDWMIGTGFFMAGVGTAMKFLSETAEKLSNKATLATMAQIVIVFLVVVGIATAINAWRRVLRRDLGVLLQASGWAINGRMPLTRRMARIFSYQVALPKQASLMRLDRLIELAREAKRKAAEGIVPGEDREESE